MNDLDTLRRDVLREFDTWAQDITSKKVTAVEIIIRPYRKEGEQVASTGKRDPSHLTGNRT